MIEAMIGKWIEGAKYTASRKEFLVNSGFCDPNAECPPLGIEIALSGDLVTMTKIQPGTPDETASFKNGDTLTVKAPDGQDVQLTCWVSKNKITTDGKVGELTTSSEMIFDSSSGELVVTENMPGKSMTSRYVRA